MISKNVPKLLVLTLIMIGLAVPLKALQYYKQDFFPIGFTGFEHTGYWGTGGAPYPDTLTYGGWPAESLLLAKTHCNFIGCADGTEYYYLKATPSATSDFYNQVCLKSNIMLATNSAYMPKRVDWNDDDSLDTTDSKEYHSPMPIRWWTIFREPSYSNGYAPHEFKDCNYWEIPEKDIWGPMADSGAKCYAEYFDSMPAGNDSCFWGYNPFHESRAIYRGGKPGDDLWIPGVYAADTFVTNALRWEETSGSSPLYGEHRMIIGKHQLYPLMQQESGVEINLFEHVPDIDAVLIYSSMPRGYKAYGSQDFFDMFLYGYTKNPKGGHHNVATYMQRYGNTLGGPEGQKRRWMACLQVNWMFWYNWEGTPHEEVYFRRPCPPEIRAMTYLCLSRGAKGMLFYPYLMPKDKKYTNPSDTTDTLISPRLFLTDKNMPAVCSSSTISGTNKNMKYVGLRDRTSKPCDSAYSPNIYLLDVPGSSSYWDGTKDTTFDYICTLIPEIKKISSKLMELDWINGYSLNSTSPEWRSPCPHYYMEDVWGVDYIDVAFFDHPYEPVGVEYFMMVNREGIADMTNRTVSVALDAQHWPEEDTLILTDIANADNPRKLKRVGERFMFTEVFEPGEGKLYRVAPANEAPIAGVPSTEGGVR